MCNSLNGISNATCHSPSLNGLNLDFDSGFQSFQVFPLGISLSASERLHEISNEADKEQIWRIC